MKKMILLILIFTLASCDDQLNKNETKVVTTPGLSVPPIPGFEPTSIPFEGIQSITEVGMTSAKVNWDHIQGLYQYYVILTDEFHREILKTVNAPETSVVITGLTPDTEYTFLIRAMDKAGYIDINLKTLSFKTLPWPNFSNLSSLSLNGVQFANIGASSNFNTTGGKTISLWFNQDASEGGDVFIDRLFTFSNDSKASSGLSLGIENNRFTLIYTNKRNEEQSLAVNNVFPNGVWHHVVVTYNNSFITLYLNGAEILKAQDTLAAFGTHPARIGAFTYRHGFKGKIDEFAYYRTSFNSMEVKDLYHSGTSQDLSLAVKNKKLVSWYRFGDHQNDGANHVEDPISSFHGIPKDGDEFTFKLSAP